MKFLIKTFGCQMNVHDSGKMAGLLIENGWNETTDEKEANLILFNTCTVRDHAHHKAISEIGRAIHRKKNKRSLIVGVCGCVAQEEKENLFKKYPTLDLVFGPDQIYRLPELLSNCRGGALSPPYNGGREGPPLHRQTATELIDNLEDYHWLTTKAHKHLSTKARISEFVTIMKGCNNHCSFCIVPSVRGSEVSRPADDIIDEIKTLTQRGVKEVVLLGQNVNSYNPPHPPFKKGGSCEQFPPFGKGGLGGISPFVHLLKRISTETDIIRIRYTSPHPKALSDDLINEHATNKKLCSHMHLPLQAGSDRILRLMKRSYNKKQFVEKSLKLREVVSGIEITTDIIVGFPTETESDFNDTLDVVREVAFDGMFAFKYSPRQGTKSAEMNDDVPMNEKEKRLDILLKFNADIWKEKTDKLIGTVQEVLVEGSSKKAKGVAEITGRTFGNKIVNFSGNLKSVGDIVKVKITNAFANSLRGEII